MHSGGNSCVQLLSCFRTNAAGPHELNNKINAWGFEETLQTTVRWVEMMFSDVLDSERVILSHSDDEMKNQACG